MHLSEVRAMQDEKDRLMRHEGKHPANMSFNEQRYRGVQQNLDREFNKSDEEFTSGKLSAKEYHDKQAAQEKRSNQYLSDLSPEEKDAYHDRMIQK